MQIDKSKFYAKELKNREEDIYRLFNSLDSVLYSFDFPSNKLMISATVDQLYGYSREVFMGKLTFWKEIIYPDDLPIAAALEQDLIEGKSGIYEYRVILPDGSLRWIQKRVTPILDSQGKLIKINGIDIDIDHRKKVEALLLETQERNRKLLVKRLEETEQRFKSLFVHHSDAIFTLDLDGRLIDSNRATEKLTGYTFGELQIRGWHSIIAPEDLARRREHLALVNEGKPQEFTLSMIHKDGRKREVSIKMIPIIIDDDMTGIYEIARDITESKITEEMIRRSDKLSAIGQLAAGVAHEIRNPLTTLKGFIQLQQSHLDPRHVDIMLTELERINLIVGEFLILSKPQMAKFQPADLGLILKDMISLLETQAILKNIQIIGEYDPELPSVTCEQNQLKQVFINLLKNAIEAMPNGGEITVTARRNGKDRIRIAFADQGVGIAPDKIPRLGEPFYSTKEEGTGLGLMVCFRIIENHGGAMNISSELNKGSTVEIILPSHSDLGS